MGRAPCCDKNGLKKGPWTPEEDLKLINYIQKHGPGNWRNLPKNAGLERCGKSCRLRWSNYLRPDIKRGRFSFEEEETIIQLHSVLGNKWSAIAARLPGRTDNEIKNYWNTHIRKRLLRMGIDPITHAPRLDLLDLSSILNSTLCNPTLLNLSSLLGSTTQALFNPELLRLASTVLSLKQENPEMFSQYNLQQNQLLQMQQLQNLLLPSLVQPNDDNHQNPIQESGFSTDQIMTTQATQAPVNVSHDHQRPSSNNMIATNLTPATQDNNVTSTIPSSTLADNLVADNLPQSSYFQNLLDYSNKDFSFDSVMSTPSSSSPTPLNSSSMTNVNSGAEDERESYCSYLLKFEIPESLDISDFL